MQKLEAKEKFAVIFAFGVLGVLGFGLVYNDSDVGDKVESMDTDYVVANEQRSHQVNQSRSTQSNQAMTRACLQLDKE